MIPSTTRRESLTRLTVVVPAYNEAEVIATTLAALREQLGPAVPDFELIVVDDNSRDGTPELARAAGATVLRPDGDRHGKGAAVRTGMLHATGRTVGFLDADLAYTPAQMLALLERVESGADVVVGSRRHADSSAVRPPRPGRRVASSAFNGLTRTLGLDSSRDTQCGIKAFSAGAARDIFTRARVDGFAFDVEIFVLARLLGYPVVEVPVHVHETRRSSIDLSRHTAEMAADLARIRWRAARGAYDAGASEG